MTEESESASSGSDGWAGPTRGRTATSRCTSRTLASTRLVAVADTDPAALTLARDNFGFTATTTDWRESIPRDDVDVVDVTAPNVLHREIVEAAARAGKHIACEKPVGIDPDATAAIELAGDGAPA